MGGYFTNQRTNSNTTSQVAQRDRSYYISFDNYYYEVPADKAVDDRIVAGGQFLYNFNASIKTNTLDDIFNGGATAVQAIIPLNGDTAAFERYVNESLKPAAIDAFKGTADVTFGNRKSDQARTAEVVAKKDGVVVRRQLIVNLPQSVNVIAKDENDTYKKIGESLGQASARFSDYEDMKLQVLSQSFMLSNRMFDDMYRLAHPEFIAKTNLTELNTFADKSKEIFTMPAKVSGISLSKNEMRATVYYTDTANPANSKVGVIQFQQSDGAWKLIGIQLPGGVLSAAKTQ